MLALVLLQILRRDDLDHRTFAEFKSKHDSLYVARLPSASDAWAPLDASDPCDRGVHSPVDRADTQNRLRYFRWLAGIPWEVAIDASYDAAQADLVSCLEALGGLTHELPRGTPCWTQAAYAAGHFSNVAVTGGPFASSASVTLYMEDRLSWSLGHRRAILHPPTTAFGAWQKRLYGALRVYDVPGSPGWALPAPRAGRRAAAGAQWIAFPPGEPSLLTNARADQGYAIAWSFQKDGIRALGPVEVARADGLGISATATPLETLNWGQMDMVRIEVADPAAVLATGFQYRVRLTVDGEVHEWYPYFVAVSGGQWNGTSPRWFSDFVPPTDDVDASEADGANVAAIAVPVVLVVVIAAVAVFVILVLPRLRKRAGDEEETAIPSIAP
jgi:hypothetical protein